MSDPTPPRLDPVPGRSGSGARRPTLVDRDTLIRVRARAAASFEPVLHDFALDDVHQRLVEVNRRFTRPVFVGPQAKFWSERLSASGVVPKGRLVADTGVLDLAQQGHDLVISALCLHWAEDPVGQLVQMRRALAPDGLLIAVMFGGQTLAELRAVLAETEVAQAGGLSPRVLPMAEIRDLGGLLQRAGLALPVADSIPLTLTYDGLPALARDLRAMGEGNALAARNRKPTTRAFWAEAAERYAAAYPAPGAPGRIRATAELITLTGWAPAASQPQPLRPGSAQTRLADALGTAEISGGETAPGTPPRPPLSAPRDEQDN